MTFQATFLALGVIIIWGSNFVAIKIGVGEIPPLMLLTLRFLAAGLIFLPFSQWPGLRKAMMIASIGLLMGLLHQGFLYVGLITMPAGLMSVLLQSQIIIVTLIGWLFLKEDIGWRTWTGIAIGISGIIVLVGGPNLSGPIEGYIYGFLSALFIALTYIVMKKIDVVHPSTYIAYLHLPITPFIFLSSLLIDGTGWMTTYDILNWPVISAVVLYQAVILSGSHIVWQKLMVRYPVNQIVPWTLLIPVFGIAAGVLFLDEALTLSLFLGGALTILGIAIITFRKIQKNQKPIESEALD